jgi:3-carboxy-cis,cis-muconate cycloisomerase
VAAISAVACAARAPALVGTLMAAMVQEHERAAGAWHAEWRPLQDLLISVGSAASWLRDSLERLTIDEGRMRANLSITHGLLLSERVTAAMAPHVGRLVAHDLVAEACAEAVAATRPLAEVLAARPAITAWLSPLELNVLLDPSDYLGSTQLFIDRALRVHAARLGSDGGHGEATGGAS